MWQFKKNILFLHDFILHVIIPPVVVHITGYVMTKQLSKQPAGRNLHKQIQPHKSTLTEGRSVTVAGLTIVILLGILIYSNSFYCSFHFDDLNRIVDNASIRVLSDVKAWWNYYPTRPIGMFSFALNYHFSKLDVFYYHLVNLIIHLINACLVWWLTILIFSSPVMKDQPVARHKTILAFLCALLFVSHPLATQSVTYIVQRLTSMVAMFYFLSIVFYVKARLSNKRIAVKFLLFAVAFIFALLSLGTKENAFTLPLAVVSFEIFFLSTKRFTINLKDYRMISLIAAILILLIVIPLKFSSKIVYPISPSLGHPETLTPFNYLLTQFSVIVKYIQLLCLPVHQNLDYDFPVSNNFFEIRTLFSFFLILLSITLAIFLFRKNRILSFGIAWFFITLLVESSFIPILDVIFEHRTYLPSFGFFLILSSGIYSLLWKKYKSVAVCVFIVIIGTNSYLTYERNKVWKNEITLWSDVISNHPNKVRPFFNRGCAYADLGLWTKAVSDYSKAIRIDPKFTLAYSNRGVAYGHFGEWNEAIADYTRTIEINPKYSEAYSNRGMAYHSLAQYDKAIADYSRGIEINPRQASFYYNRGIVFSDLKQWDNALADYTRAIEINPMYTDAYSNRGITYGFLLQWDKSIADYTRGIEIDPKFTKAYSNRGHAYGNIGKWDSAISDYSKAITIDPNFSSAYYNRGIAYGYLGQWSKAIADFSKSIELDPNFPDAYSNRQLAYERLGSKKDP
jgi:protein O-mannosyl-transferase